MPELITRYPDTVIEILQTTPNVRCGNSAGPPQILTRCPQSQFCRLPQGELCIYGLNQIDSMTQLRRSDLCPNLRSYDSRLSSRTHLKPLPYIYPRLS